MSKKCTSNNKSGNEITRREFCKNVTKGVAAGVVLASIPGACGSAAAAARGPSRIVRVNNTGATDGSGGKYNDNLVASVVNDMVDRGVKAFSGKNSTMDAWSAIIPDPSKRIAIKVNCENRNIFTKYTVVGGIIAGLQKRGVSDNNIIIYDRNGNGFSSGGFEKNTGSGIKVGRVNELGGYNYLAGRHGMANLLCGNAGQYNCDYLINVPCLKALDFEGVAGVTLSMKNHFGTCMPDHNGIMDKIPFYNTLPEIKGKTRLIVMDAIFCSYRFSGGDDFQGYVDTTNTLYLGTDPVAIDYLGWQMIEQRRQLHGLGPISPVPTYIHKANINYGLGTDNPSNMTIIDIGSNVPNLSTPQNLEIV